MAENQFSIHHWSKETFGQPKTQRCVARANEEMAELVKVASTRSSFNELMEEAADIVIVLNVLAGVCSRDLWAMVEAKMKLNRSREWVSDGNGCGYHK